MQDVVRNVCRKDHILICIEYKYNTKECRISTVPNRSTTNYVKEIFWSENFFRRATYILFPGSELVSCDTVKSFAAQAKIVRSTSENSSQNSENRPQHDTAS
jgi:hypothetical protein